MCSKFIAREAATVRDVRKSLWNAIDADDDRTDDAIVAPRPAAVPAPPITPAPRTPFIDKVIATGRALTVEDVFRMRISDDCAVGDTTLKHCLKVDKRGDLMTALFKLPTEEYNALASLAELTKTVYRP